MTYLPNQVAAPRTISPQISFLAVVVVTLSPIIPFARISDTGYHDGQRIVLSIFCGVALMMVILRLLKSGSYLQHLGTRTFVILLIFSFLGLISAVLSVSPRHGFYEWANTIGLLIIASAIAKEIYFDDGYLIDKMILGCAIGCSLYIFQAMVAYVSVLINAEQPAVQFLVVGFDNYRFLNHIQTIGLPLLGLLVVRGMQPDAPKYSSPYFWIIIISFWWMLTFVTAGRKA